MAAKRPSQKQPSELPAGLPEWKACPDCFAEGREPYVLPVATHFYIKKAARYPGGYRVSAYCKEHESKRNSARVSARLKEMHAEEEATGITPPALERRRERDRARSANEPQDVRQARLDALNERVKALSTEARREANRKQSRRAWDRAQQRKQAWYLTNRQEILARRRKRAGLDDRQISEYRPRPGGRGRQEYRIRDGKVQPTRRRIAEKTQEEGPPET